MRILIIILTILFIYILILYNNFIRKRNRVKQAKSAIDVYLTQRIDLIPNLVECVKGYMKYERETFTEITLAREKYLNDRNLKEGGKLNERFNQLIATAEDNPNLKANLQFANLCKTLSKIESQLQAARRIYNTEVNTYNSSIQIFPNNLVANMFNFREEEFFQAEVKARENINVK